MCRAIAKREAKNFYYAFLALPAPRKNAICAIYAFMRQADDLADDESLSRDERRRRLDEWLVAWREASQGGTTADPVFIAVRDATTRFGIPLTLLDELVAGTTMDLKPATSSAPDTYATFADLYRYCYLVASVVGLVCIRIFGYSDPRAEKLAEETGIAFQLTNILRDVAEDASGIACICRSKTSPRIMFPSTPCCVVLRERRPRPRKNALLEAIAHRAENYYKSAQALLPLIDSESRPALWVLVSIYHALLKRIELARYDVFSNRVSVPLAGKIAILGAGLSRMAWTRLFGR